MPPALPFLSDLYAHLPFMVVQLTTDGIILHCNPATIHITEYEERDLLGKNFWATLFPGKLFAQVPRFISLLAPAPLLKDTPMTLRTRTGKQRIVAFSRFTHAGGGGGVPSDPTDSRQKTFVCIGIDLTDRLLDADKDGLPEIPSPAAGTIPFGPHSGDDTPIDGDFVQPIAISPPSPRADSASREAIRQAHDVLSDLDKRMAALVAAHAHGETRELNALAALAAADARGLADISGELERLHRASSFADLTALRALVGDIVAIHQPEKR